MGIFFLFLTNDHDPSQRVSRAMAGEEAEEYGERSRSASRLPSPAHYMRSDTRPRPDNNSSRKHRP
jgi:hypothetical protein